MTPKRIQPTINCIDSTDKKQMPHFQSSLGEIPVAKKKLKREIISLQWENFDQQPQNQAQNQQKEDENQSIDLFGQQFFNLGACSYKTISKAGLDKASLFGKNDIAQFEGQFQSGKKNNSFLHMSEQKLRYSDSKDKNRKSGSQRFIGFGSLNQISKFQKKHSYDHDHILEPLQKNKRRQSSIAGSLHTINTQMMNDIMEFNIKDENQIDAQYLKNMMQMALIDNVIFTANLLIKFLEKKGQQIQYSNIRFYKLLDVDGFSITGFYSQDQRMRIKLSSSMTNKEFEKRILVNSQSNLINDRFETNLIKQRGIQFNGVFYRHETYDWQQIIFYLADIKDLNINHYVKEEHGERLSLENIIVIPEAEECVELYGNYYDSNVMK